MNKHQPVMVDEVVNNLNINPKGIYVDATLGSGGYSQKIKEKNKNLKLISFDIDENAIQEYILRAGNNVSFKGSKVNRNHTILKNNFSNIVNALRSLKISKVDGIVADLGWSTSQLKTIQGLSFENQNDALDMRLDKSLKVKAFDLLNALGKRELSRIFIKNGNFNSKDSSILAKNIVEQRKLRQITKVFDLNKLIDQSFKNQNTRAGKNLNQTRARIFQCLRIAVNAEYEHLDKFLIGSFSILKDNGVICIVTFHSGEERVVKDFVKGIENKVKIRKIYPSAEEIVKNKKARSAKLWVIVKKKNEKSKEKNTIYKTE